MILSHLPYGLEGWPAIQERRTRHSALMPPTEEDRVWRRMRS